MKMEQTSIYTGEQENRIKEVDENVVEGLRQREDLNGDERVEKGGERQCHHCQKHANIRNVFSMSYTISPHISRLNMMFYMH